MSEVPPYPSVNTTSLGALLRDRHTLSAGACTAAVLSVDTTPCRMTGVTLQTVTFTFVTPVTLHGVVSPDVGRHEAFVRIPHNLLVEEHRALSYVRCED